MAWEKPVLATSVFGLPELIDDGETGWLCEPNDVAALAAGLDRALGTPEAERGASRGRRSRAADRRPRSRTPTRARIAALLAETARHPAPGGRAGRLSAQGRTWPRLIATKARHEGFGLNASPSRKRPTESQKLQSPWMSFQENQWTA